MRRTKTSSQGKQCERESVCAGKSSRCFVFNWIDIPNHVYEWECPKHILHGQCTVHPGDIDIRGWTIVCILCVFKKRMSFFSEGEEGVDERRVL